MGNTSVATIRASMNSILAAQLGTGWSPMEWQTNMELNSVDFRDMTYGVMSMGGPQNPSTPVQSLMFDQEFAIFLCRNVIHDSGDSSVVVAADALIGLMVDCLLKLVQTRCGNPVGGGVMNVFDPSYKEPVFKTQGEFLILEGSVKVTYRVQYS